MGTFNGNFYFSYPQNISIILYKNIVLGYHYSLKKVFVLEGCFCQLFFLVRVKFHIKITENKKLLKKNFKCTKLFIFLGNLKNT